MPRVTVIIPAHNAAAYLPAALESVIAQTYTDWEVIVIDDGSTDHTRQIAESYADRLPGRLRYLYQPNQGVPAARNHGIRESRGELIALLDADDVWLPHRLSLGVAALDRDPQAGLAHARVVRIDTAGTVVGQLAVDPKYMSGHIARHIFTRRAHIICATVIFRRACLDTAGWFDENMRATEDRDLWFRIARRYRIVFIDQVLAHYRLSPASLTKDLDRLLNCQVYFVNKHYRAGACTRLEQLQALGNIHREMGDSLFRRGALAQSIRSYSRAVAYYPLNVPNTYMLVRAIMDPLVRVCIAK